MKPYYYPTHILLTKQFSFTLRSLTIMALLAGSMLSGTAFAQTLQLQYDFEDAGTTTANSGPLAVSLNMLSSSSGAVDLHGALGSGIQNMGKSLNISTNPLAGNLGGAFAMAQNSAALGGLGVVSNFTATVWMKMPNLNANTANQGARLYELVGTGITDIGGAVNNLGFQFQYNNSATATFPKSTMRGVINNIFFTQPLYDNYPTNEWIFLALTYDSVSGNGCLYYGTEVNPAKLCVVKTVGAGTNFDFSGTPSFSLGDRPSKGRSFAGWIDGARFYTGTGDANYIENIRQSSTPVVVAGLVPDGSILQGGTNTLSFKATSASGVNASGIQVLVNGTDVSSSSYITYTPTAGGQIVTYTNLPVNPTLISQSILNGVNIKITVTDLGGIVTSNSYVYDAFSPNNFSFEAEDYDFGGGMFIDNPDYTFAGPAANTYYQEQISYGTDPSYVNLTDANDNGNLSGPGRPYRDPGGNVETEYSLGTGPNGGNSVGELMRQKVLNAYAVTNTARDVNVGYFDGGAPASGIPNWMNYTRTYPSGSYNAYMRVANGGSSLTASFDQVTSGFGTSLQTITNIGTFNFVNTGGWDTFAWVPLRDGNGNLIRVTVPGVNTLRMTAGLGGGGNFNFVMFVPANTNLPVIGGIYPNGTNMFQPANVFTFTASSPAGITINPAAISVLFTIKTLTGQTTVTNITTTNGLVVTGTSASRNVSAPLVANQIYTAVIKVTDVNGSPATTTVSFDTLSPNYTWEAEDYDYGNGQFFDNPQTNAYVGQSAGLGVDSFTNANANLTYSYRAPGGLGDQPDSDSPPRLQYIGTGFTSYNVGWNDTGDWGNYTRPYPSGSYNLYARAANGNAAGSIGDTVATVTSGVGTPVQTTTNLGTFSIPGNGNWQGYVWVPLRDTGGNLVKLTLGGQSTLRVTANPGGGGNLNFFALFPANTNLPSISNVYPNGTTMFEATNKLVFKVSSSVGVNTSSIVVTTNGVAATNLVFSGSSLSWTVSFTNLLANNQYAVAIAVTDINGNVASTSVSFDTFSSSYYTWEAEDFDYSNGQYIDNPQTNAYLGFAAGTDVDTHQVNFNAAAPYLYRTNSLATPGFGNGMATEVNGDIQRSQYLGTGFVDYAMGYFSGGANTSASWANYTRHYPAGTYNVYGRLASGGGATTATLSQVTSELGNDHANDKLPWQF